MNLAKAIELLSIAKEGFPTQDAEDYYKAMELGIEAMRRELKTRKEYPNVDWLLLPGETKE